MNKVLIALFFCCIFQVGGIFAQTNYSIRCSFDKKVLLKHLQSLSSDAFEGRRTGTKGATKARKYIINQFHNLKVEPLGKSFEQPFSFIKKKKVFDAVNVLGLIEGSVFPEKYIVISAHYDHEGVKYSKVYNGADDNASGVGALFAFAEYFKNNPPKHSVILAAFDAEELGLQGSKYYVNHSIISSQDIIVNINMDMISRSNKKELYVVGTSENKKLKSLFTNSKYSSDIELIRGHDGYDGLDDWTYTSDHASFHKKGIPFLYFGVEDHKDYHEPTDDYENIHPLFYVEAVKTIISVFEKMDCSVGFKNRP
ncbi:M28 family peptidase [uncultured Algibacter sp.]|uniref:M28 family peptidase n=1 Tax=uncultured Algibacter sp. TaxID=298659 RepID=UPI00262C5D2A|nr:M28 family peptidase [uncultured Algibacter sp.]